MTKPRCSRLPCTSFGSCAASITFFDCGQPRPIGSFSAPSSSMLTNSTITKLSSSVVTTSSTPKRVLRNVGPSSSSAPGQHRRRHDHRDEDRRRQRQRAGAEHHRHDRAGIELRLAADVPQLGAERDRGGKAGEDQRRRAGQRLQERKLRSGRALRHRREHRQRRRAAGQHQQCGDGEAGRDRHQRRDDPDAPRRFGPRLKPHGPPRRSHGRPSSGRADGWSRPCAPSRGDMRPRYITTTRSASASSSSRSSEISSTPAPSARAFSSCWWT